MLSSIYFKVVLYTLCLIGCMYHVVSISLVYFAYETVTRVSETLITHLPVPNISLCIDYNELINYNIENRKHTTDKVRPTVKDIFNLTPNLTGKITSCAFRLPNQFTLLRYNSSACTSYFRAEKFLLNHFICYRISLNQPNHNPNEIYDYRVIYDSFDSRGTIFTLQLSNKGFLFNSVLFVSHYGVFPYYSNKLSSQMARELDLSSKLSRFNLFTVSFRLYDIKLLPKPYDTMCTASDDVYRVACYEVCMEKELAVIDRVPFMNVKSEPVDMYQFNIQDFRVKQYRQTLTRANKNCYSKCNQSDCITNFSLTRIVREKGTPDKLVIANAIPTEPSIFSVSSAKIELTEFIIYVSSALGIWFGFNVSFLIPKRRLKSAVEMNKSTHVGQSLQPQIRSGLPQIRTTFK